MSEKIGNHGPPGNNQPLKTVAEVYSKAVECFSAARYAESEQLCKQILLKYPEHVDSINILGAIAQQFKRHDLAVKLFQRAIEIDPDRAIYYQNLGTSYSQLQLHEKAVAAMQDAVKKDPKNAEFLTNLGIACEKAQQVAAARDAYQKALAIQPNIGVALLNLGVILFRLSMFEQAAAHLNRFLEFHPNHPIAIMCLGNVLERQGKYDQAVETLQTGVEKNADNLLLSDCLIDLLNSNTTYAGKVGLYTETQKDLLKVRPEKGDTSLITDATVKTLYQENREILGKNGLYGLKCNIQLVQPWRGIDIYLNCRRHTIVFETYNIIPEFCFNCYKIYVEPRTVMELIKLFLVFDQIRLPTDPLRKCLVEIRPEIAGTYKGMIYCQDREEAKEALRIVRTAIAERISPEIPVNLKRGCSEHAEIFPDFARIDDEDTPQTVYKEEWRKFEEEVDKQLIGQLDPPRVRTENHTGLTLKDALCMRNWLTYAENIGDTSYRDVCSEPTVELNFPPRPPFQAAGEK